MLCVIERSWPQFLRFASHDCFGVSRYFLRTEAGMKAAHHHWHAASPIFAGDLVGPFCGVGLDAHRHKIGRFIERDRLHPLVIETHVHIARSQSGEGCGGQRLHLPGADVTLVTAPPPNAWMDERELHAAADATAPTGADGARPMIQSQL